MVPFDFKTQETYRLALRAIRPGPACAAYCFLAIVAGFAVPGMLLCGWVPQQQIVSAIAVSTIGLGVALLIASWCLERRSPLARLVDDLFLSGVLVLAAGMIWCLVSLGTGPAGERKLDIVAFAAIALFAAAAGLGHMHRRAAQLARLHGSDSPLSGAR